MAATKTSPTDNSTPSSAPSLPMEGISQTLTPTQQEAQTILSHILAKLTEPQTEYYARYGKWIERHQNLAEFCFRCVRPSVWVALEKKWQSFDTMKAIGGELPYDGRGVYFDVMIDQYDARTRLYIGQSFNLKLRKSNHEYFRYRRDNPSLHYHALQRSKINKFGLLCSLPSPEMGNHTLPGMDKENLLLNVLEMWMCLVFRCLPQQTLDARLPNGVHQQGQLGGLNIQSPLDHGGEKREWVDLSEAEDPLVREYERTRNRSHNEQGRVESENAVSKQRYLEPDSSPVVVGNTTTPWVFAIGVAVILAIALARPKGR